MRVLLVNPHPGRREEPVYPLGLAYVAAALNNHEVRGCDLQLASDPVVLLDRAVDSFQPDVVAIAIRNVDSSASYDGFSYLPAIERCLLQARSRAPGAAIVVGGPGFSLFAAPIMRRYPQIDFGLLFEAEDSFPALLNNLDNPQDVAGVCYRNSGDLRIVARAPLVDFEALPPPDRSAFPVGDYAARGAAIGVQTKRGCPFGCIYCTYPHIDGHALRARSPVGVADEIESLVASGARRVFFCDSILNTPSGRAEAICSEILERDLPVEFLAFFNESLADRDQLELARNAGCRSAVFGPDGGHPTALKSYRKTQNISDLTRCYDACRELELPHKCAFLMNGPGETVGSFGKMLWFVLRQRLKGAFSFSFSTMRIYPNTELHRVAVQRGLIAPDDDLLEPRYHNPQPLRLPCAALSAFGRVMAATIGHLQWRRPNRRPPSSFLTPPEPGPLRRS